LHNLSDSKDSVGNFVLTETLVNSDENEEIEVIDGDKF
jgi:hypothetical protein